MYQGRRRLTARDLGILSGLAVAGLAVAATLLLADIRWSSVAPGGAEFFSAWAGARAFLLRGTDPYDASIATAAQELAGPATAWNGPASPRLGVPFFLLPVYFPLALIPEPALARAVWIFLSQVLLVGAVLLCFRLIEWEVPRRVAIILSLLLVFDLYSVSAINDGSPAVLLVFAYTAVLWAMAQGHDELAGALVAACLFLLEAGLPILILLTWRVIHEQRRRIVAGFAMSLTVMLAIAFLLWPGWALPFLTATVGNLRSANGFGTGAAISRLIPDHGSDISRALIVLILAALVFEWAVSRDSDFRRFTWLACLALASTPLLGFRSEMGSLSVMTPALVLVTSATLRRARPGPAIGTFFLVVMFAVPWLLFLWRRSIHEQLAQDLILLLLPLLTVVGLYWIRWWFLKPAQTWLDEIRAAGG